MSPRLALPFVVLLRLAPLEQALQATETSGVPAGVNAQSTVRHVDFTLNANRGFDYGYDLNGNETGGPGGRPASGMRRTGWWRSTIPGPARAASSPTMG